MTTRRRRWRARLSRDTVLFLFGLAGIVYETVVDHGDKPTLLILFAAMVGLPAFLHSDERVQASKPSESAKIETPPEAKK